MNVAHTTRPRDVQITSLARNTTVLRSRSWQRLRFEAEYSLQKGTTANSFLIQADRTALVDPPGETFTTLYLQNLEHSVNIQTLDYLILGHVNVNRAVTLRVLLDLCPQVTLICSNPAALTLQSLFPDRELLIIVVRGSETLDLGQGHQLQFWVTPTPRWPDLMCTYDSVTRILFSDKLFGCHLCAEHLLDENRTALLEDQQHYFQSVFARAATQIETILDRFSSLSLAMLAPNHGPILRYGIRQMLQYYRLWSHSQRIQTLSVALLYASAYGNTAAMAQSLAQGLATADIGVDLINCEIATPLEMQQAVECADGILLGSPTLGGHVPTQMQTACGIILAHGRRDQLLGVFGSYGWSGEAVDELAAKLQDAGFRLGFAPLRIKFKPTTDILKTCEETGHQFAQALRQSQKLMLASLTDLSARPRVTLGDRRDQAMGRLLGSVCVITARRGATADALLSSWIAQASFSPPGISLSIPINHPITELLNLGDFFAVNVLQEGKQVRKHFQKRLSPGEDQFKGVDLLDQDPEWVILKDALAYLKCQVKSRIEGGDHWILFATLLGGEVLQPQGRTAVLYRQVGVPIEQVGVHPKHHWSPVGMD